MGRKHYEFANGSIVVDPEFIEIFGDGFFECFPDKRENDLYYFEDTDSKFRKLVDKVAWIPKAGLLPASINDYKEGARGSEEAQQASKKRKMSLFDIIFWLEDGIECAEMEYEHIPYENFRTESAEKLVIYNVNRRIKIYKKRINDLKRKYEQAM